MKRIVLKIVAFFFLGATVFCQPYLAFAQHAGGGMLPDASNAKLPEAQHNLGLPTIVQLTGDGVADDWTEMQAAIDAAVAPAILQVAPRNHILFSQALRMRDQVTIQFLDWGQRITCAGSQPGTLGQWPFYHCVMFGSGESNNLARITPIDIDDVATGDVAVTLTAPNYASLDPVVGDIIIIGSTQTFNNGNHDTPVRMQMVRITGVDAGANSITIHSPIEVQQAGMQIRKLTNNGLGTHNAPPSDTDSGIPQWATWRAGILGGNWEALISAAAFASSGGCLECTVRIKSFKGGYGVGYLNLWAGATGEVENEYLTTLPIELSWGAHGNRFSIGRVEITGTGTPAWMVGSHESARGNRVSIGTINTAGSTPINVVHLDQASASRFEIGSVVGQGLSHNTVNITSGDFLGAPIGTFDNTVRIDSERLGTRAAYASMNGVYLGSTATVSGTLTGYTNGDVVTQGVTGGACKTPPTWTLTVTAGNVTAATVANPGTCGTRPTNPVAVTGGTGTGLTLTVTFIGSATVNNTIEWGSYHGTITNGGGNGWVMQGVGTGNWVSGWGENGAAFIDPSVLPGSGWRNLRTSTVSYIQGTRTNTTSGTLISGLTTNTVVFGGTGASGPATDLDVIGSTAISRISGNFGALHFLQGTNCFRYALNNDGKLYFASGTNSCSSGNNVRMVLDSASAMIGFSVLATSAALKPNGGTLDVRLFDDSAYTFVRGKLRTDTDYTAGVPVVTGYLTLYDAAGTAYKVPACTGC